MDKRLEFKDILLIFLQQKKLVNNFISKSVFQGFFGALGSQDAGYLAYMCFDGTVGHQHKDTQTVWSQSKSNKISMLRINVVIMDDQYI